MSHFNELKMTLSFYQVYLLSKNLIYNKLWEYFCPLKIACHAFSYKWFILERHIIGKSCLAISLFTFNSNKFDITVEMLKLEAKFKLCWLEPRSDIIKRWIIMHLKWFVLHIDSICTHSAESVSLCSMKILLYHYFINPFCSLM